MEKNISYNMNKKEKKRKGKERKGKERKKKKRKEEESKDVGISYRIKKSKEIASMSVILMVMRYDEICYDMM